MLRGRENRPISEDQHSLGSIGYIAGSIGYMGGSMGYLSGNNVVSDYPYHGVEHGGPGGPIASHYGLWKPSGGYYPRGEAPPPYEEAVAAAHAEAMASVATSATTHRTIPINIATSTSFRIETTTPTTTNVQIIPGIQQQQQITSTTPTISNINITSNTINVQNIHRERERPAMTNSSSNTPNTIPNNMQHVNTFIGQTPVVVNTTTVAPNTRNVSINTSVSKHNNIATQANTSAIVNNVNNTTQTSNSLLALAKPVNLAINKKNKSILSHLEQCEACSQQANALENESVLDLNKMHSAQDLAVVLPPPLFDIQEIKDNISRHRTIPRHLTMGAILESYTSTNTCPPSTQLHTSFSSNKIQSVNSPFRSSGNNIKSPWLKQKPISLSLASTTVSQNQAKTKSMPLSLPPSRSYTNNRNGAISPPLLFDVDHAQSHSPLKKRREFINTPPPVLANPMVLSIAQPVPGSALLAQTASVDDTDDYRSECENCKSAHGSRYYLQEEEELGSPHETMTLQRKPLEGNDDDSYYRTSLTLPTNTKKNRSTPLHQPCSARESWFSSMPSSSSSEDD